MAGKASPFASARPAEQCCCRAVDEAVLTELIRSRLAALHSHFEGLGLEAAMVGC